MEALNDIVRAGKALYIGASSMYAWQFAKMQAVAERHGWSRFVSMQNHYNLVYREEEREMIPLCREDNIAIIPWGPLARGFRDRGAGDCARRCAGCSRGCTRRSSRRGCRGWPDPPWSARRLRSRPGRASADRGARNPDGRTALGARHRTAVGDRRLCAMRVQELGKVVRDRSFIVDDQNPRRDIERCGVIRGQAPDGGAALAFPRTRQCVRSSRVYVAWSRAEPMRRAAPGAAAAAPAGDAHQACQNCQAQNRQMISWALNRVARIITNGTLVEIMCTTD